MSIEGFCGMFIYSAACFTISNIITRPVLYYLYYLYLYDITAELDNFFRL